MGFPKGSIALNDARDKPLLLQVLHSQFITHDQLFEFMQLGAYEFSRAVFNWRTRRLVSCGFLLRHLVPPVTREPVYTIENTAKLLLVEHFPFMDRGRRKAPASHVNLTHSLELNRLHLSLMRQEALVTWESEMSIRATNELTPDAYAKTYDAIVTVRIADRLLNFALEYERTPKKPKSYLRIRDVLEREGRVGRFLYLALERNLESLLVDCFAGTSAAIYVGLAPDFRSSVREMKVIDAATGQTLPLAALP